MTNENGLLGNAQLRNSYVGGVGRERGGDRGRYVDAENWRRGFSVEESVVDFIGVFLPEYQGKTIFPFLNF
jgi:hypothetical protein